MSTLAAALGTTAHLSVLRHKARRLGVATLDQAIALAASRGCRHYRNAVQTPAPPVSRDDLPDDELVILLLLGEHPYQPLAIRAAAQLARSSRIQPRRLAALARQQRTERVLTHIAHAGCRHDEPGRAFWSELLEAMKSAPERAEPALPHWSRFVSMPGIQRKGPVAPVWLTPTP